MAMLVYFCIFEAGLMWSMTTIQHQRGIQNDDIALNELIALIAFWFGVVFVCVFMSLLNRVCDSLTLEDKRFLVDALAKSLKVDNSV
jgi:hypothetical protein